MFRELNRIIKNKGINAIFMLCIVLVFALAINYAITSIGKGPVTGIAQYDTFDDVAVRIADLESHIEELRAEPMDNEEEIARITTTVRVYKYLLDNKITYDYVMKNITNSQIEFNVSDSIDYSYTMWALISLFILIISIVLALTVLNADFETGIYKQLYCLNDSRKKLIRQKYSAYIISVGVVFVVLSIIVLITSLFHKINYHTVLIVGNKKVYAMNAKLFIFLAYISTLIKVAVLSSIFFATSLLIRNMYTAVFVNVVILGAYTAMSCLPVKIFSIMTAEIGTYSLLNISVIIFLLIYLTKIAVSGAYFVLAHKLFYKKDL